ncbi:MAG: GNAT family N-acetyltransferase [Candidatus Lokiarchaeota archaeon]|nr:GNAT family N-acetyltransferase [Candidatus Lokiarchaeota archaeon]
MKDIIIIKQPCCKEEFDEMYNLRWSLLYHPWNQPKGSEKECDKFFFNERVFQFITILKEKIIGTAQFHINNEYEGQIEYLAVHDDYQCQGIGKKLIEHIEWFAKGLGIPYISLNVIKKSKHLFEKLDYHIIGEGPLLFNEKKQYKMGKNIIPILIC